MKDFTAENAPARWLDVGLSFFYPETCQICKSSRATGERCTLLEFGRGQPMTIPLVLDGAFAGEQALRDMIVARKVCFDHAPFYVPDGSGRIIQIGFQLNLYAAFQDARHVPFGEDPELHELVGELHRLCRVFFQSLDLLKSCQYPETPMHRIIYSPERRYRAEVCLQVPIFDRAHYGVTPDRSLEELLATAECLLRQLGARREAWDDPKGGNARSEDRCEDHARAAAGGA